jgi:transposase
MSVTRRRYPREFKVDAVRRVVEDGQPQTHVAHDLGIPVNTLAMWKRQYLADSEQAFPGNGRQKPDEAELTRLRREVARLKRENELLKKAAAYFAKESR